MRIIFLVAVSMFFTISGFAQEQIDFETRIQKAVSQLEQQILVHKTMNKDQILDDIRNNIEDKRTTIPSEDLATFDKVSQDYFSAFESYENSNQIVGFELKLKKNLSKAEVKQWSAWKSNVNDGRTLNIIEGVLFITVAGSYDLIAYPVKAAINHSRRVEFEKAKNTANYLLNY